MKYSKETLDQITKLASMYLAKRQIYYSSKDTIPEDYDTEYELIQCEHVKSVVICSDIHPLGYKDVDISAWLKFERVLANIKIHGQIVRNAIKPHVLAYMQGYRFEIL